MFIAEPAIELGGRVPLLGRRLFIGRQDRVDDRLERIEQRRSRPPVPDRRWFRLGENFLNFAFGVMVRARSLTPTPSRWARRTSAYLSTVRTILDLLDAGTLYRLPA